ncbi:MAG: hypothetical protein GXY52_01405 [Chloroflexi bacterium]|nr:hypothetical protein [Chloroflexota bacterium]
MSRVTIDYRKVTGPVKPMHCINNGPIWETQEILFPKLKEAGIPYARLHDTGYPFGSSVFVDIECIFRDFDADPDDPAAYDFAFTDWLLSTLIKNGTQPFYRLGASIENSNRIKAYHIFPPKDNLKWAHICEGIIRHYNEGWADGFEHGITYWEIWNEPENSPNVDENPMWKGTKEQYFALYETTANHLKARFPNIKVGGYASCGFYAVLKKGLGESPISARTQYFVDYFHEFLDYIKSPAHASPLDFFSWHSYGNITETRQYAAFVRQTLDEHGFPHTESILNEWNPGIQYRGTLRDSANILGMICAMQNDAVDMLMYYDGQINTTYGGLWDPVKLQPFKAYYSLKAFNVLYTLGQAVAASAEDDELYTCAASGDGRQASLLVNTSDEPKEVEIRFEGLGCDNLTTQLVLDETHNLEQAAQFRGLSEITLTLAPYATVLFESR